MSEQDKRAEEVWREAWRAYERSFEQYDVPNSGPVEWDARDALADAEAFSVLAAALAQARREGYEKGYHIGMDNTLLEIKNLITPEIHARFLGTARLLAKEEGRE